MFECDGTTYELAYGRKRLESAEAMIGGSVIQVFRSMPTIRQLVSVMACGMRREGDSNWMNPKQALGVAEAHVEEAGLMTAYQEVTEALDRDCGFLFR